jgi:hypothetical protein
MFPFVSSRAAIGPAGVASDPMGTAADPQANRAICRILFIASSAATLYASARVG